MTLFTDDRRLLVAFRAGEREVLELTYNHYVRPLASFLRKGFGFRSKGEQRYFRGIQSDFELDNALQEVFARAFAPEARNGYDGIRPYLSYLFAIAKNYVIDQARRPASRYVAIDLDDLDPEIATRLAEEHGGASPAGAAESAELQALLAVFIETRDDSERKLYAIRYGEHASQVEAAQRLGLSRAQVRRIEAELLRALLRYLRAHGYLTEHEVALSALVRATGWIVVSTHAAHALWRIAP